MRIVEKGAKILHARSLRLAAKNYLPLKVVSFYDPEMRAHAGTLIGDEAFKGERPRIFEG
jgi:aspartokinase